MRGYTVSAQKKKRTTKRPEADREKVTNFSSLVCSGISQNYYRIACPKYYALKIWKLKICGVILQAHRRKSVPRRGPKPTGRIKTISVHSYVVVSVRLLSDSLP